MGGIHSTVRIIMARWPGIRLLREEQSEEKLAERLNTTCTGNFNLHFSIHKIFAWYEN